MSHTINRVTYGKTRKCAIQLKNSSQDIFKEISDKHLKNITP